VECGADVTVFALRKGNGGLGVPAQVVYPLMEPGTARRAGPREALRRVLDAAKLGGMSPRELILALRRAGPARAFVLEVSRRGIGHLHAHFASLPTDLALMVARMAQASVSFSAHARDLYVGRVGLARKLRGARLCITCTEANAALVRSLAEAGDQEKVACVYHGTDLERFALRARTEAAGPPRIVAIGRMVPKKGFGNLLQACALMKERQEFACEIVGNGPLAGRLSALSRSLGVGDIVTFSSWVPYEAMPAVYARADVLAAPCVQAADGDQDALPNVIVEAMAAGVPVVASNIGGIPEAIRHEETGLLCPPGDVRALADALSRMLGDAALRRRVASSAQKLAEQKFDCRKSARIMYGLLRRAAEGTNI
jgi:glycosyltransferase involved in cell wall biosynthesis